jgi:hypothetical protein
MIHDLQVPNVAAARSDGHAQFGTITNADANLLGTMGSGNNRPGNTFTSDGQAVRVSWDDGRAWLKVGGQVRQNAIRKGHEVQAVDEGLVVEQIAIDRERCPEVSQRRGEGRCKWLAGLEIKAGADHIIHRRTERVARRCLRYQANEVGPIREVIDCGGSARWWCHKGSE